MNELLRYYAHSANKEGNRQTLTEHLSGTAELACEFGKPLGLEKSMQVVALLHDLGKSSDEFQQYLLKCEEAQKKGLPSPRSRLDHKSLGALLAAEHCQPLAFPIFGHHGGLPSMADLQSRLAQAKTNLGLKKMADNIGIFLQSHKIQENETLKREILDRGATSLEMELLLRILYSCLVDADSLDTERHFEPDKASLRGTFIPITDIQAKLEKDQQALMAGAPDSAVNQIRRSVYEDCLRAASLPPGVFRLTVPTGGGKTRSSLAFALRHAAVWGMGRVIYAIPYTSITEQTADVFRKALKSPQVVLEHHSAITDYEEPEGEENLNALQRRLAAENWDAPLIVTTSIQLFESLFASSRSRCRKVHRIARSVIVLDEVQALPVRILEPMINMLQALVDKYGTTVVLCTATQPALQGECPGLMGFRSVTDIVKAPENHFRTLARVEYRLIPEPQNWQQIANRIREYPQSLVIVNTRKDAQALLNALNDPEALHLSTLLCGAHRRDVLLTVKERLLKGLPCRLISTQVVEAGVDLDFPVVMRAIGPLERIVQAAGRCNREGKLDKGIVFIFIPAEGTAPKGEYRTALQKALPILENSESDLHDPGIFEDYFRALYSHIETDAEGIQALRQKFNYPEVEHRFRMIPEETVSVLVPYREEELEILIKKALEGRFINREFWRKAQPHMVSIYRREFNRYLADGMIAEALPGSGIYRWFGGYDEIQGIWKEACGTADLIV